MKNASEHPGEPAQDLVEENASTLLLVDDEPSNIKLLERAVLAGGKYKPISTSDPREVVELCRQHDLDLIVLDLNMPLLNGFQVMNQLRAAIEPSLLPPILIVTAQHDQEYRIRALKEGAVDYVTKPYMLDELLARVGNLVKIRRYQKRMLALNHSLEARVRAHTEELFRSRQMIRELAAHNEKIREAERARIAREIHDEFGQYLTALRMDTAMLNIRFGAGAGNEALKQQLDGMKQTIDTSIGVVRNLASTLRPGALDMGLVSAAEWLLAGFEERTGIHYRLHAPQEDLILDNERATAAFRILQEALTNITRYAHASAVEIDIQVADAALVMVVRDDGIGFDPAEVRTRKTFGLLGIRERVLIFGGESRIDSTPGNGTILYVRIPT